MEITQKNNLVKNKELIILTCPECNTIQDSLSNDVCQACEYQFEPTCQLDECWNPSTRKIKIEIGEQTKVPILVPICEDHYNQLYSGSTIERIMEFTLDHKDLRHLKQEKDVHIQLFLHTVIIKYKKRKYRKKKKED